MYRLREWLSLGNWLLKWFTWIYRLRRLLSLHKWLQRWLCLNFYRINAFGVRSMSFNITYAACLLFLFDNLSPRLLNRLVCFCRVLIDLASVICTWRWRYIEVRFPFNPFYFLLKKMIFLLYPWLVIKHPLKITWKTFVRLNQRTVTFIHWLINY